MSLTESLNVFGVDVIVFLQDKFPSWATFFMNVSTGGDPSLAFTFFFPLTVALSSQAGFLLLTTLLICEWSNMILKWVLAGDRPFWWVHESSYYLDKKFPLMKQTPITCETGPGMPSGHSTLNAALFFVLMSVILEYLRPKLKNFSSDRNYIWTSRLLWTIYGLWIFLVVTSRTFIAAHFPHQCVAGVVIGILVAKLVLKYPPFFAIKTKKQTVLLTSFLLISVFGVFGTYRLLGNDPMWSVSKAVRWCARREYIHIDSKPFYALSRFSGLAFGLGMAMSSVYYKQISNTKFSTKMKISLVVLTIATGQATHFIHRLLPSTLFAYYFVEFLLNSCYVFLVAAYLPAFVASASGAKVIPKTKIKVKK